MREMTRAEQAQFKDLMARHQRLRSQLPAASRQELERLAASVRTRLFTPLPRFDLLRSAAQIVSELMPELTPQELASVTEYALASIAAADSAAAGNPGSLSPANATQSMQETQMSFNLQYLKLSQAMQAEGRSYALISNILKAKHDTLKNSIGNVR